MSPPMSTIARFITPASSSKMRNGAIFRASQSRSSSDRRPRACPPARAARTDRADDAPGDRRRRASLTRWSSARMCLFQRTTLRSISTHLTVATMHRRDRCRVGRRRQVVPAHFAGPAARRVRLADARHHFGFRHPFAQVAALRRISALRLNGLCGSRRLGGSARRVRAMPWPCRLVCRTESPTRYSDPWQSCAARVLAHRGFPGKWARCSGRCTCRHRSRRPLALPEGRRCAGREPWHEQEPHCRRGQGNGRGSGSGHALR